MDDQYDQTELPTEQFQLGVASQKWSLQVARLHSDRDRGHVQLARDEVSDDLDQ